jgi:replication factor C small subunit
MKVNEIIGQTAFCEDAWAFCNKNEMPNILLHGPQGTGKTSAGIALGRDILKDEFDFNFLELNASDDRKLETVRTKIKEFASTGKMGESPFKVCLLDEIEGMTIDAQNALKRIMERYSNNVRFIVTANDRNKIILPLQSRCANYFFSLIDKDLILLYLRRILKNEGLEEPENLEKFVVSFNGDLRRCLTELQAAMINGTDLNLRIEESLERWSGLIKAINANEQDVVNDSLHSMIYEGVSVKDICNGLHDAVLHGNYDRGIKYKLLRIIGETEYRSKSMTPRVVISWMIAQTL